VTDGGVAGDRPGTRKRRWPRPVALSLAVAIAAGAGLYGLAYVSTSSSGLARAIVWKDADVMDYKRFPSRTMEASSDPLVLGRTPNEVVDALSDAVPGGNLREFLENSQTAAFIVIRNGAIAHESYFNGYDRESTVTSFSVAKSFVSTLVGIALEDGSIGGIDDPVTDYVPELGERDPRFSRITLRHLLTMSSGLRWNEEGLPWSDDAETYYGTDLRRLAINDTEIVGPPGETFLYNPYNTLLLGLVLERATGENVSDYMAARLWQPMGASASGTWSLDSPDGFEKMESGLNGRAIDMAKLGLLFLQRGRLNGSRIVSGAWVSEATAVTDERDPSTAYGYQWWTYDDPEVGDWFAAQGNKGQFIGVFPSQRLVIARFGIDFGYERWPGLLADMAQAL
jgi:CubicO group peptidase (beta-lactamase class C family)